MASTQLYPNEVTTITATGVTVIKAEAGVLSGVHFIAANSSVVAIYDNASAASGKKVFGTTNANTNATYMNINAECENGITLTQTGTCEIALYWR